MEISNAFQAQPALVKHIKESVPDFKTVGSPSLLLQYADDIMQLLPACILVPQMPVFDETYDSRKGKRRVNHVYYADIYVPFINGHLEESATELLGGLLFAQTAHALRDYVVNGNYTPVKIMMVDYHDLRALEPFYSEGFAIFPLKFNHSFIL